MHVSVPHWPFLPFPFPAPPRPPLAHFLAPIPSFSLTQDRIAPPDLPPGVTRFSPKHKEPPLPPGITRNPGGRPQHAHSSDPFSELHELGLGPNGSITAVAGKAGPIRLPGQGVAAGVGARNRY
jgi:hypothetical protein